MTPESFPSTIRGFGMGVCSASSRMGGFVSPYIVNALHSSASGRGGRGWGGRGASFGGCSPRGCACRAAALPHHVPTSRPPLLQRQDDVSLCIFGGVAFLAALACLPLEVRSPAAVVAVVPLPPHAPALLDGNRRRTGPALTSLATWLPAAAGPHRAAAGGRV